MGLVSWLGSAFVAEAAAPALPAPTVVSRRGYEYGISDQGLNEYSPGMQSQDRDRRSLMAELYDAYVVCPWAWAAVNAVARRITAGGLEFVWDPAEETDRDAKQPKKPAEVLACERLFRFVNERENIRQLLRGVITDLLVFGDAYIEVVWKGRTPVALFSLDCPSTSPTADAHGQITGYVQVTEYGQRAEFEPHEVIHISLDSPRSGVLGISPTQAALVPINRWLFAAATQLHTYRRGDPMNLHVDLPREMSGPDVRRWVAQHMARNVGPGNVGYPVVTKGGGTVAELGVRRIEAGITVMDKARDEILASYGVPPAKAGVIESGNIGGGTDEGQDKTFDVQTCDPLSALVLEALYYRLAVRGFGISGWKLQFSEVDTRDSKKIEEIRELRFKYGAYTLNEWRAEIGRPPVEGGDQALVLISQGGVIRVRDIDASTLATMAKEVNGSGWDIGDRADPDEPILLVRREEPAEGDQGDEWGGWEGSVGGDAGDDQTAPEDDPAEETARALFERAGGQTGGMVALLPDADTAAALAVAGGLDADELHLTLAYLGDDVTGWAEENRADLVAGIRGMGTFAPITGKVLGRTVFNGKHTVYLVGDAAGLDSVLTTVRRHVCDREGVPAQREPFVAHVTAGEGLDPDDLAAEVPLRFDRLAVVLAGEWVEIPLGQDTAPAEEAAGDVAGVEWAGWERDVPTAAHYTGELLDALTAAFDAEDVARSWLTGEVETVDGPTVQELRRPTTAQVALAVRWLAAGPISLQGVLARILTRLLWEAFLIGVVAARRALTDAGGGPPATPPTGDQPAAGDPDDRDRWWDASLNLDAWDVGDAGAAERILGDNGLGEGLQELLAASEVALTGIADERMAEFARILAQALADGDSVETLAIRLRAFQTDRVWARRTAITETARGISAATVDRYLAAGVERHEWLVAGTDPTGQVRVCPRCDANSDQGPVQIGEPFTSGAAFPPQHPNCRCALIPVIDLPDEAWHPAAWGAVLELGDVVEGNALRDYWLKGKGLARWTTWTQLYNLIRRHVPDGKAKRIAAQWFHDRYGFWPGDKRNRKEAEEHGWEWSVEEARYVRTARGALRFKLPIGAEIKPNPNRTAKGAAAVARASGVVRPSGPGGQHATATVADDLNRKPLMRAVERAERVRAYDADPGSHIAAAMQRALTSRKPVWLHSAGGKTVTSLTPPPPGGAQFLAKTDGTVWRRSFTRGRKEERLQQVPDARVRALVAPHVGLGGQPIPRPAINPRSAARNPRDLDDIDLDEAMQAAITQDTLWAFEKLAAEADRRDEARHAKQRREEAEEQRKAEEYERLITRGYSDEEAYAVAYDVDPEQEQRKAALQKLRNEGYQGRTLEDAARAAFRDQVYEAYMAAEDATNGYLLTPKAEREGVDPLTLFTGPEHVARARASEELRQHWDEVGRPTFEEFLAELLGDSVGAARMRNARSDFNQ